MGTLEKSSMADGFGTLSTKKKKKHAKSPVALSGVRLQVAAAANNSHGRASKVNLMVLVLAVFVCGLSLRLFFVQEVILQHSLLYDDLNAAPNAGFLANPDSSAYIYLARNFFTSYLGRPPNPDALWRTAGYPAFLAPFYILGLAPSGILITQAALAALVPVLALLFAQMLTGSAFLAGLAGLLSAVSPTGIGLGALIMNDMLLAFMLAAGLYFLYLGAIKTRPIWIIIAGILFGCGVMVKPVLMLWSVFIIPIYLLFCRGEKKPANWKALGIAIVIQVVMIGLYSTRNYIYEDVFTPSSTINFAMHDYLRPRVEEWVKAGRLPNNQAVRRNRDETRAMFEEQTKGIPTRDKLHLLKARSMEVLRAHPLITLQVVLQDTKEHALSGWDFFFRQLPLGNLQVKRLIHAAHEESALRGKALIVIAVFLCSLLIYTCFRPTPANRRLFFLASALMLVYGYFALFSGTVFWGGSRIMYPVEFAMILLIVMALQAAGALCRGMLKRAGLFPDTSSPTAGVVHNSIPWVMTLCVISASVYGNLTITEKDAETYSNSGLALASRGKISESVQWFQKALKLDPENLQAKSNLATAYVKLEKYGEGVPLLREIVRARPGDANNNYLLGVALANSGSLQEGIKYIQEALRINPNQENARNTLNMLIKSAEHEPSQLPAD